MRRFAFVGRLVAEKGFDLLFPTFDAIVSWKLDASFSIFGDGPLMAEFLKRYARAARVSDFRNLPDALVLQAASSESGIRIFGFRPRPVVERAVRESDCCVVPSRFLETFGLSALESLAAGVPVVAVPKGGLSQFVVASGLEVSDSENPDVLARNFWERIRSVAAASDGLLREWKISAFKRARDFSVEAFDANVRRIMPAGAKKILLVTDFSGNLGGTETYVANLADRLRVLGYETRTHSRNVAEWNLPYRVFSALAAFCNVSAYREIRDEIERFRPDVVWCHTVLRRIGPVWTAAVARSGAFKIVTYHDFGCFAPSASGLEREREVPKPGFFPFVAAGKGVVGKALAVIKYAKISALERSLRTFDLHLVPSPFMEDAVRGKMPSARVETLAHFIP